MFTMTKPKPPSGKPKKPAENPWPKRLKALRILLAEKAGKKLFLQEEAAKKAEVSLRNWQNWESGHRQPSAAMQRLLPIIFPELKNID